MRRNCRPISPSFKQICDYVFLCLTIHLQFRNHMQCTPVREYSDGIRWKMYRFGSMKTALKKLSRMRRPFAMSHDFSLAGVLFSINCLDDRCRLTTTQHGRYSRHILTKPPLCSSNSAAAIRQRRKELRRRRTASAAPARLSRSISSKSNARPPRRPRDHAGADFRQLPSPPAPAPARRVPGQKRIAVTT